MSDLSNPSRESTESTERTGSNLRNVSTTAEHWTWELRSRDGGMNGLEFSRCLTNGGQFRVLVHAAPAQLSVEVRRADGALVAAGEVTRDAEYAPMTLLELDPQGIIRSEVWPNAQHHGLVVLLAGGEAAVLRAWQHSEDRKWWKWTVEFSNHRDRPAGWTPPD